MYLVKIDHKTDNNEFEIEEVYCYSAFERNGVEYHEFVLDETDTFQFLQWLNKYHEMVEYTLYKECRECEFYTIQIPKYTDIPNRTTNTIEMNVIQY